MIFAILFLIVISIGFYFYTTLNNKLYDQRKQILVLKHENSNLKHKLKKSPSQNIKSISIEYATPKYNRGIIINYCNVYLSPVDDSMNIITSLKQDTHVLILDSAIIRNTRWLRVYFDNKIGINNKGWIIENNVKADYI